MSFREFGKLEIKDKFLCIEALMNNLNLIDDYIADNGYDTENIEILNSFKKHIKGKLIVYKTFKDLHYFLSLDNDKCYAVKALKDSFEDLLITTFPTMVETVLIPFKNEIIYDGFIQGGGIFFGEEMTYSFEQQYLRAKRKKEIIYTIL